MPIDIDGTLITVEDASFLVSETASFALEVVEQQTELAVDAATLEIVAVQEQGPPGTSTVVHVEEEMPYAKRTDFVGDDVIYKGRAVPGSLESEAKWQILKVVIGVDGDISESFAGGSSEFDKVWLDRASLSYV